MLLGELSLLTVSVFVLIGVTKKLLERLYISDFVAMFFIFLIVFTNISLKIIVTEKFSLMLGGIIYLIIALYMLIMQIIKYRTLISSIIGILGSAVISFLYYFYFAGLSSYNIYMVAAVAALICGTWCAIINKTLGGAFASATAGSSIGIIMYGVLTKTAICFVGESMFGTMVLSSLIALIMQYLLTFVIRAVRSPQFSSYFEAGELMDMDDDNDSSNKAQKNNEQK